jgi:uncharacterized protein involved in outer membrane biogenesis
VKFVYGILAILALIVVAAFVAPMLLDWERFKPEITEEIEAQTGRELWIDGEISVSILPSPKITITDARLANLPGASVADMARIKSIDLALALGPLISGDIEITSLDLVEPIIELERLADGRSNWQFDARPPETGDAAGASDASGLDDSGGRSVQIDSIAISGGTLIYRDAASQKVQRVEQIEANLSARSLDGPFRGEGELVIGDSSVEFRMVTRAIDADRSMPATLEVGLSDDLGSAVFEGTVSGLDSTPALDGNIRANAPDLGALMTALAIDVGLGSSAEHLNEAFSAKGAVSGNAEAVDLSALQIRLGESQATGAIAWRGGDIPLIDAQLALNRIDLDQFMPTDSAMPETEPDTDASSDGGSVTVPDQPATFAAIPTGVTGSINLSIGTVKYRDGVVRQAQALLALDEGVVTIQQAFALLPGGADVMVFGQVASGADGPSFDGKIEMVADDLRAVLAWLSFDVAAIPADRLRRFSATADVIASTHGLTASKFDVRVDATRLAGGATVKTGDRVSIVGNLAVDSVNADAYLRSASAAASDPEPADDGDVAPATDDTETTPTGTLGGEQWQALAEVDADLKLAIGNLTYRGMRILGLKVDALLENGDLTLREASVTDAAGMRASLNGTALSLATKPRFDIVLDGAARSLSGLMPFIEVDPDFRPETLGEVALQGSVAGDADAVTVDLKLATRAGEAALIGTVATPLGAPTANLGLRVRAPDAAELARVAGLVPSEAVQRLGALAIDGGLDGDADGVSISVGIEAAGATLQMAGDVDDPVGAPSYQFNVDLRHPRAAAFAETLTGEPADGRMPGHLALTASITGDRAAADISDLVAEIGGNRLTGGIFVGLDQDIPRIKADLRADELDLAMLGAGGGGTAAPARGRANESGASGGGASAGAGSEAPPKRGGQWSREALDLSFLERINGALTLNAGALIANAYRFEQAQLELAVEDGALAVQSLRGRIFDGTLEAEGGVTAGPEPTGRVTFHLEDIDVGAALRQAAEVDAVTGRATIDGRFATQGASEYALVQGLNGDATIASRDGSVEGVDLPSISRQLDDLDDFASYAALTERSLSGGTTAIRSLDGTIQVQNGLARTDDLKVIADSGEGDITGTADLPAWLLDLTAMFRLVDHPEAPPLGVRVTGAINDPQRDYVIDGMRAYLVERGLLTAARKAGLPKIKLRDGASAEPGTVADTLLRELLGDPDEARQQRGDDQPAATDEPPLAPQYGDSVADRPPVQAPLEPAPEPAQERRGQTDDLEGLVKDVLRGLGD